MWRWTVFLYLLIFYGHSSSQPISDDNENARQARQLDFSECCPCTGPGAVGQHDFSLQESLGPVGEGAGGRMQNVDDCSCGPRHSDSEGASSVFFPTAMRADGSDLRPTEKKEEFKPLLHPEVDLASSVLETLREVTDEEYQEALARDAARTVAKATENTIFGDATPEASARNVFNIIVNPKQTENEDDFIPQESRNHESLCTHPTLESVRTNPKMRVVSKPPSLLREIFGLPKISKPAEHSNLWDIDNNAGASNIQQNAVHFDGIQISKGDMQGFRKYAPPMKFDSNINLEKSPANEKISYFKPTLIHSKLKDLISSRSPFEGQSTLKKTLPLIPKMKIDNLWSKAQRKETDDLTLSPSNINEETAGKASFFRTKSHLEDILERSRPLGLKHLLKLKDVELVPLKDLVNKEPEDAKFRKPKWQALPALFNKDDNRISTHRNKNPTVETKARDQAEKSRIEDLDPEVSPSHNVEQISGGNCELGIKNSEDKITSNETHDIVPSFSDIQPLVNDKSTELDNNQLPELNDQANDSTDCGKSLIPETNVPQSTEIIPKDEIQDKNSRELNSEENQAQEPIDAMVDDNCVNVHTHADSLTDSSNNFSNIVKQNDVVPANSEDTLVTDESCSQEENENDGLKSFDVNANTILNKHNNLVSVKENLTRTLENLKPKKSSPRNSNIFESEVSDEIENKQSSPTSYENQDADCQNEESIKFTTMKPEVCNEDIDRSESSGEISMEDLQKISDSILQQDEKDRETKTEKCSDLSTKVPESKIIVDVTSREIRNEDLDELTTLKNAVVLDQQQYVDTANIEEQSKNSCPTDSMGQNQSVMLADRTDKIIDGNSEASEVVINRVAQNHNIGSPMLFKEVLQPEQKGLDILRNSLTDLKADFKPVPLPKLDNITLKLTNFFDKSARAAMQPFPSKSDSVTETSNILSPSMATDASTRSLRLKSPLLRLEDVDLDILQLTPQSDLLSKIPKIDLHSYQAKLPLPKDLALKPLKLQSSFEGKGNILGATLTVGRNKLLPSEGRYKSSKVVQRPETALDGFKRRVNTDSPKILNTPFKSENLRSSAIQSQELTDLSENIHSHAKNALRKMQRTLESKFGEVTKLPITLQSQDLLEVIAQNHEDVNDKLRALHIDFNDRLESMHNDLFDRSRLVTSQFPKKTKVKPLIDFGSQNNGKQLSMLRTSKTEPMTTRKESKKSFTPRRHEQQRKSEMESLGATANKKKFKMPAVASVAVPKTVEIPQLKATSINTQGPAIQRPPGINSSIRNIESRTKEISNTRWKPSSTKLPKAYKPLEKQINPFKDSKIKVSFSTTPRPTMVTRTIQTTTTRSKNTKLGKDRERFGLKDTNGSPSEVKQTMTLPPSTQHKKIQNSVNFGTDSESRQSLVNLPRQLESTFGSKDILEVDTHPNNLQSWPKVSDSAFLSKVREALKARLTKVNSFGKAKHSDVQSKLEGPLVGNQEGPLSDMARSASENLDVTEVQPLQENISYKCKMVCTKA